MGIGFSRRGLINSATFSADGCQLLIESRHRTLAINELWSDRKMASDSVGGTYCP